jgi:hypothetical protein
VFDNPPLREATKEDAGLPEKSRPAWEYETDQGKEACQVLSWIDTHGKDKESWTKPRGVEIGLLRRYVEGLKDVHTYFPNEWTVDGHVPMQLFPRLVHNIRVLYEGELNGKEDSSKGSITHNTEQNHYEDGGMDLQGISSAESDGTGFKIGHLESPSCIAVQPLTEASRQACETNTRGGIAATAGWKRKRATKDQETPDKRICNRVSRAAQRDRAMVEDLAEKLENFVAWGQNLLRAAQSYLYA